MDIRFDKMSPEEKFKILLKFVKDCGININTGTRARGHQGFFMKNRIDISKTLDTQRKIEVLVHEFAHYAHCLIEPDAARSHGSLKTIFKADNTDEFLKELLAVTRFKEKNTVLSRLEEMKLKEKAVIKEIDAKIKAKYPDFKRSEPFKKLETPLKRCDAKYLLKYDRVKIRTPFTKAVKTYSIANFLNDFSQFDEFFEAYINLKSRQRMLKRISARINRLNNYYARPSELFARFCESIYINRAETEKIAPESSKRFFMLLKEGYYGELKGLFELCGIFSPNRLNMNRDRRVTEPFFQL